MMGITKTVLRTFSMMTWQYFEYLKFSLQQLIYDLLIGPHGIHHTVLY